jgi:hypothetical protein
MHYRLLETVDSAAKVYTSVDAADSEESPTPNGTTKQDDAAVSEESPTPNGTTKQDDAAVIQKQPTPNGTTKQDDAIETGSAEQEHASANQAISETDREHEAQLGKERDANYKQTGHQQNVSAKRPQPGVKQPHTGKKHSRHEKGPEEDTFSDDHSKGERKSEAESKINEEEEEERVQLMEAEIRQKIEEELQE